MGSLQLFGFQKDAKYVVSTNLHIIIYEYMIIC